MYCLFAIFNSVHVSAGMNGSAASTPVWLYQSSEWVLPSDQRHTACPSDVNVAEADDDDDGDDDDVNSRLLIHGTRMYIPTLYRTLGNYRPTCSLCSCDYNDDDDDDYCDYCC